MLRRVVAIDCSSASDRTLNVLYCRPVYY